MNKQEFLNTLNLFNVKADKLQRCSFCNTLFGKETHASLHLKRGEPMIVTRKGPSQEAIDAFVLTFRFFIQDNETTSFNNMAKLYRAMPIDKEKKELFEQIRNKLNIFLDIKTKYKYELRQYTVREIVEIFVYGGLAHATNAKKVIYEKWMDDPYFGPVIENEFVEILGHLINYITSVQNLNEKVIKELVRKNNAIE